MRLTQRFANGSCAAGLQDSGRRKLLQQKHGSKAGLIASYEG